MSKYYCVSLYQASAELNLGSVLLNAEMCEIWLSTGQLLSYLSVLKD